jgi:hypothetical protein
MGDLVTPLVRRTTAKRLNIIAQGFSPGYVATQESALKGRPIGAVCESSDTYIYDCRGSQEVDLSPLLLNVGRTACPHSVATFRARICNAGNPGLKPWAEIYNRFAVSVPASWPKLCYASAHRISLHGGPKGVNGLME